MKRSCSGARYGRAQAPMPMSFAHRRDPRERLPVRSRARGRGLMRILCRGLEPDLWARLSRNMLYAALATDYDGTIAHHGRVSDETIRSLRWLKDRGKTLILATGRE